MNKTGNKIPLLSSGLFIFKSYSYSIKLIHLRSPVHTTIGAHVTAVFSDRAVNSALLSSCYARHNPFAGSWSHLKRFHIIPWTSWGNSLLSSTCVALLRYLTQLAYRALSGSNRYDVQSFSALFCINYRQDAGEIMLQLRGPHTATYTQNSAVRTFGIKQSTHWAPRIKLILIFNVRTSFAFWMMSLWRRKKRDRNVLRNNGSIRRATDESS